MHQSDCTGIGIELLQVAMESLQGDKCSNLNYHYVRISAISQLLVKFSASILLTVNSMDLRSQLYLSLFFQLIAKILTISQLPVKPNQDKQRL